MTLATALSTKRIPQPPSRRGHKAVLPPLLKGGRGDSFSSWLTARGTSTSTIASYEADLRVFERWHAADWGPFKPEGITNFIVQAWRDHTINEEDAAPATWNRRKASLSVYCQYLRAMGVISLDPMRGVNPAEEANDQRPPRWPTAQELGRMLRWMELADARANTARRKALAMRNNAIIALMLYAGLRIGEVCRLKYGDLTLTERKGNIFVRDSKGHKSGDVPVSAELRRWLAPVLVDGADPHARIFPVTTRSVEKWFKEMAYECKIDDLTPHCLRHASVKRMYRAGVDPVIIQQIHRHAKRETTDAYARPGREEMEDAVERGSMASLPKGR